MTSENETRPDQVDVLLVTGMSGAGKTTAARVLEDLDWYVVDNLPPQMIAPLLELVGRADGALPKVAVVADIRGRSTQRTDLDHAVDEYLKQGIMVRVLFLDASDDVLVQRFESVRRPHPLQGEGTLLDGIAAEREALDNLRHRAGVVIDTSELNVHELGREVRQAFSSEDAETLRLTVMSFGFKNGVPKDGDHVADVRFLPNPHWVPHLRPFNGTDREVADFVFADPGAGEFLDHYTAALRIAIEGYLRESRGYATIAVGCTGGKHRSVAMAEELGRRLREQTPARVTVRHRDLGRE
ncbi:MULTISPECIES: RNase adapter RapZ [Brevibacterium]|uniref:RNase adapter RapZ n=1 Tax=Brevibacterium salitolerans TaxID=1403566 RepID=A0ABN2WFJ7_9MICO|nr:RNase adapter RapZ [Brevibacterium sp.]